MEIPASTRWGISPPTWPSSFAHSIKIASISTTILKSIGDKGYLAVILVLSGNNDQCHH
jgi:hypothetical protein